MDKIYFGIGVITIIVGILIIFLSFGIQSNKINQPSKEKIKELKKDVKSTLNDISKYGISEFQGNTSKTQIESIRLKSEMEKILGINAQSKVDYDRYERPVNDFGLEEIRSDLISLSRQLDNIN